MEKSPKTVRKVIFSNNNNLSFISTVNELALAFNLSIANNKIYFIYATITQTTLTYRLQEIAKESLSENLMIVFTNKTALNDKFIGVVYGDVKNTILFHENILTDVRDISTSTPYALLFAYGLGKAQ